MGDIFLRCAFEDDAIFLFNLVNDQECRENSFNSEKITFEENNIWLKRVLHSVTQKQYILIEDGLPVGQGRLEMKEHSCRISYSIIPERRGYGYGKRLVQLLSNIVLKDFPDCRYCYGEVLKKNVASQKIFEELGYIAEENESAFCFKKNIKANMDAPALTSKDRGGILLLSNNRNSYNLYDWLEGKGEHVYFYSGKLTEEQVSFLSPQLVVSYNYGYLIPESIIQLVDNKIINMHISYLPWNRGADPNFWSFIDDTPKGITIHQLSAALDQGKVLLQKEYFFNEKEETFKSTYEFLNREIIKLFKENFYDIKNQQLSSYPQQGAGTSHKRKDLLYFMNGNSINWNETIYSFKKRIERSEGSCDAVYSCGCK